MITAEEIIKEINNVVKPFEFKLKTDTINRDFIKSIGKEYILAVDKKIGEIAEILKKYKIFVNISYDKIFVNISYDEDWDAASKPEYWHSEDSEYFNDDFGLITDLHNRLSPALNIDYYLLRQCINIISREDNSIYGLKYI